MLLFFSSSVWRHKHFGDPYWHEQEPGSERRLGGQLLTESGGRAGVACCQVENPAVADWLYWPIPDVHLRDLANFPYKGTCVES